MKKRILSILLTAILLASCSGAPPSPSTPSAPDPASSATSNPTITPAALDTPQVHTTQVPDVRQAVRRYLDAWAQDDYPTMYAMLAPASQDATDEAAFTKRHKDVAVSTTLKEVRTEILSTLINPANAQAAYRVTLVTNQLGEITRDTNMNLILEKGEWRVQWEEGMILPELRGGRQLLLEYKIPARGDIYASNGYPLAITTDAIGIGIVPASFRDGGESGTLSEVSRLTEIPSAWIKSLYGDNYTDQFIPVGETLASTFNRGKADALPGFSWQSYSGRYYSDSGLAPHVVGYVLSIFKEELETYQRQGYRGDERVGKRGLEKWGENYLAGTRGLSLYVTEANGKIVTRLAQTEAQPAYSLHTTIDGPLQFGVQRALSGFTGAIVVLERDSGRVLAMAASPGFDNNFFVPENINSTGLNNLLGDQRNVLVNRAAESGYPLGSVFKIVSLAAALESGIFKPTDTYECGHFYTELAGYQLKDWTYDKELAPSGMLTILQGLTRSCNPWFYHIGYTLYEHGQANKLTEFARAFGLGVPTGIEQIAEFEGSMPDPKNQEEAVFISIGQDKMQVTPLQVADMVAAVGNGGTLYRPQMIEKITDADGNITWEFEPVIRNKLPVSAENLALIQDAMRQVIISRSGTAMRPFSGLAIPVYGKTGTAETGIAGQPHAWFALYTDAKRENKPDIAVAVIAEYAGEGSEIAAPIARRVVELYFLGQAQRIYSWESQMNVTRTPTPIGTESSSN